MRTKKKKTRRSKPGVTPPASAAMETATTSSKETGATPDFKAGKDLLT